MLSINIIEQNTQNQFSNFSLKLLISFMISGVVALMYIKSDSGHT